MADVWGILRFHIDNVLSSVARAENSTQIENIVPSTAPALEATLAAASMDKLKYSCCGRYYFKCKRAIRERFVSESTVILLLTHFCIDLSIIEYFD